MPKGGAQVGVPKERRLLSHRTGVRLPRRKLLVGVVLRACSLGRAEERDRLQLGAAATFRLQAEGVGKIPAQIQGGASDVGAAEEIRLVLAAVVPSSRSVPVGEATDRRDEVEVLVAAQLRPSQRDERLVDAEVRFQPPVAGIRQVVRGDLDRRFDAVVSVVKVELRPGRDEAVRVAPIDVVGVRHHRRAAELRSGVRPRVVHVLRLRRAPRKPHGRAEVAGHVELPFGARLRGDHGSRFGRGRHPAPLLRDIGRDAQRWAAGSLLRLGRRRGRGAAVG